MALVRRHDASAVVDAIVEDQRLAQAVPTLDVDSFASLVRHVGLEDSGCLLALASPQQWRALADEQLWRADPGRAESFDSERFGIWIQVLLDEGAELAAKALMELDEDLLALAISQHAMVLNLDELAPAMALGMVDDAALVEKLLESSLSHEFDEFLLLAVVHTGWDALVEVVHELDARDRDMLRRVLERTCAATMDRVAQDGLSQVLTAAESLMEDARGAREDRGEQRGFVSNRDAKAVLRLAEMHGDMIGDDPVTKSYFRNYQPTVLSSNDIAVRLRSAIRDLGKVGALALPEPGHDASPSRAFMRTMREQDPNAHAQLSRELVYLANVLCAGVTLDGEPLGQAAAIQAVLTMCDGAPGESDEPSLIRRFGAGWKRASSEEPTDVYASAARALRLRLR